MHAQTVGFTVLATKAEATVVTGLIVEYALAYAFRVARMTAHYSRSERAERCWEGDMLFSSAPRAYGRRGVSGLMKRVRAWSISQDVAQRSIIRN